MLNELTDRTENERKISSRRGEICLVFICLLLCIVVVAVEEWPRLVAVAALPALFFSFALHYASCARQRSRRDALVSWLRSLHQARQSTTQPIDSTNESNGSRYLISEGDNLILHRGTRAPARCRMDDGTVLDSGSPVHLPRGVSHQKGVALSTPAEEIVSLVMASSAGPSLVAEVEGVQLTGLVGVAVVAALWTIRCLLPISGWDLERPSLESLVCCLLPVLLPLLPALSFLFSFYSSMAINNVMGVEEWKRKGVAGRVAEWAEGIVGAQDVLFRLSSVTGISTCDRRGILTSSVAIPEKLILFEEREGETLPSSHLLGCSIEGSSLINFSMSSQKDGESSSPFALASSLTRSCSSSLCLCPLRSLLRDVDSSGSVQLLVGGDVSGAIVSTGLHSHLHLVGPPSLLLPSCNYLWDGHAVTPLSHGTRRAVEEMAARHSATGHIVLVSFGVLPSPLPPSLLDFHGRLQTLHCRDTVKSAPRKCVSQEEMNNTHGVQAADMLKGQILVGLVTLQELALPPIYDTIDVLHSSCVRFIYFSPDNSVRTRLLAQRMGLDVGWNCDISLKDGVGASLASFGSLRPSSSLSCPLLSSSASSLPTHDLLPPNLARMPTAMNEVRPHLEDVDNVPLLVSIFTDCCAETRAEMVAILQFRRLPRLLSVSRQRVWMMRVSLCFFLFSSMSLCSLSLLLLYFPFPFPLSYSSMFCWTVIVLPVLSVVVGVGEDGVEKVAFPSPPPSFSSPILCSLLVFAPHVVVLILSYTFMLSVNGHSSLPWSDAVVPSMSVDDINWVFNLMVTSSLCLLSSSFVFPLHFLLRRPCILSLPWVGGCLISLISALFLISSPGPLPHFPILSVIVYLSLSIICLAIGEIHKSRVLGHFTRESRKRKFHFDTRLGMNSPY